MVVVVRGWRLLQLATRNGELRGALDVLEYHCSDVELSVSVLYLRIAGECRLLHLITTYKCMPRCWVVVSDNYTILLRGPNLPRQISKKHYYCIEYEETLQLYRSSDEQKETMTSKHGVFKPNLADPNTPRILNCCMKQKKES